MIDIPDRAIKYIGIGACVIVMLSYVGCLRVENSGLKKDLDVVKTQLVECKNANASNQETISTLKEANETWASTCGKVREAVKIAGDEADKFRTELRRLRGMRDDEARRVDYANPKCKEILAIDFESACPAIASGLRERSNSSDGYGEGAVPSR